MFRRVPCIPRPKVYGQTKFRSTPNFVRSQPQRFMQFNQLNKRFFVSHRDENDITKIPVSPKIDATTRRAPIPAAAVTQLTGMPVDVVHKRKIVIYKPSRNAMQSGTYKTKKWRVEWEAEPKIDSPLMGWMGSKDALACVRLDFDTLDAAVHHVESSGYPYEVREETDPPKKLETRSYSDNFAYVPPRAADARWAEVEDDMEKLK